MQRPHRPHFVAAEHPWQPSHRVPKPHDRSLAAYVAQLKKIAGHPHPCRKNPPLPGTEASITGRCNLLGSNVREPSPCTISCGSWACWGFPVSALFLDSDDYFKSRTPDKNAKGLPHPSWTYGKVSEGTVIVASLATTHKTSSRAW